QLRRILPRRPRSPERLPRAGLGLRLRGIRTHVVRDQHGRHRGRPGTAGAMVAGQVGGEPMPVLYLTEDDVRQVLTMEMALDAVETGLKKISLDEAVNIPRSRCQTDHSVLHVMSAAGKTLGVMGFKAYVTNRRGAKFHVNLFDGKTGEHLAWMQADYLGQVRTGAASGVATKYLARADSSTVGIF